MKFQIAKEIDYEKLDKNIHLYEEVNDESPYLFMNRETIELMSKDVEKLKFTAFYKMSGNAAGLYKGCPIYCNDDLEYGEVELR